MLSLPTNESTNPMNTTALTPPESVEPSPADSTPLTFKDLRSWAAVFIERLNTHVRRSNLQDVKISQLTALVISLKAEIECMQVREDYQKQNLEAKRESNSLLSALVEETQKAGRVGALANLEAAGEASPPQREDLNKLLGF